ncbi:hypothetical protein [Salinactinospora qingdaonensis]|uniref:Major facilitator superfamily (MFS) profile domain-containing protein n=1 Tax=Salinactinospora qingdaonensis TaxID=702744 RepID=A0ABP7EYK7_9ACTN
MTRSRFAAGLGHLIQAAVIGAGCTVAVSLLAFGLAWAISAWTGETVIGANIGLGLALFALRLVATPALGWWLARRVGIPRPGTATLVAVVLYLLLAWLNPMDLAPPAVLLAQCLQGALAGAGGCYVAMRLSRNH